MPWALNLSPSDIWSQVILYCVQPIVCPIYCRLHSHIPCLYLLVARASTHILSQLPMIFLDMAKYPQEAQLLWLRTTIFCIILCRKHSKVQSQRKGYLHALPSNWWPVSISVLDRTISECLQVIKTNYWVEFQKEEQFPSIYKEMRVCL